MPEDVKCARCRRVAPGLSKSPHLPESLATEVMRNVCGECWKDWEAMEVMVINEHRLNFIDPAAADILHRHLREFLAIPATQPGA